MKYLIKRVLILLIFFFANCEIIAQNNELLGYYIDSVSEKDFSFLKIDSSNNFILQNNNGKSVTVAVGKWDVKNNKIKLYSSQYGLITVLRVKQKKDSIKLQYRNNRPFIKVDRLLLFRTESYDYKEIPVVKNPIINCDSANNEGYQLLMSDLTILYSNLVSLDNYDGLGYVEYLKRIFNESCESSIRAGMICEFDILKKISLIYFLQAYLISVHTNEIFDTFSCEFQNLYYTVLFGEVFRCIDRNHGNKMVCPKDVYLWVCFDSSYSKLPEFLDLLNEIEKKKALQGDK